MPRVSYDERRFWRIKSCAICIDNFERGDQVTPLRCDMRHTFHSDCIAEWFQENNICPTCRRYISPDDMRQQRDEIEALLEERGRKLDEHEARQRSEQGAD